MTDDQTHDQEHDHQPQARKPFTYEGLIDERIAQALADGLFDNLPGRGRPQRLDDDALVPEADRAGYRLLKANGFAPMWIEARTDLSEERARLAAWLAAANADWPRLAPRRRQALRAEYRQKLEDLQRAILHYNLRLPRGVSQLAGLRIDEELAKLGTD